MNKLRVISIFVHRDGLLADSLNSFVKFHEPKGIISVSKTGQSTAIGSEEYEIIMEVQDETTKED